VTLGVKDYLFGFAPGFIGGLLWCLYGVVKQVVPDLWFLDAAVVPQIAEYTADYLCILIWLNYAVQRALSARLGALRKNRPVETTGWWSRIGRWIYYFFSSGAVLAFLLGRWLVYSREHLATNYYLGPLWGPAVVGGVAAWLLALWGFANYRRVKKLRQELKARGANTKV